MINTTDVQESTYDERAPFDELELAPASARTGQVEHIREAVRPHFVENVEEEAARKGVRHLGRGRRPRRVVSPKTPLLSGKGNQMRTMIQPMSILIWSGKLGARPSCQQRSPMSGAVKIDGGIKLTLRT